MRAIDADAIPYTMIYRENWMRGTGGEEQAAWKSAIDAMPTIEPKRKKGKWSGYNTDNPDWLRDDGSPVLMTCSECNGTVLNDGSAHWNFCPNCGADLRGD